MVKFSTQTAISLIRSTAAVLISVSTLLFCASANAAPVVDGFASLGEYSNALNVTWYNDHNTGGTQFPEGGSQTTAVYYDWQSSSNQLYLYLEAPISAKNMIWGSGWTEP
jgi:hypothetical protein